MGKIYYMMGKSSSGKDTLYGMLMKDEKLRLKTVVPYTTRPMRAGEENGVSYYFCDEDTVEKLEAEGKIIELRAYHTIHGIWKYFTVADHQVDLDHQSYLLIGTLESYLKIREYFGTESVVPIYIEVEVVCAYSVRLRESGGRKIRNMRNYAGGFLRMKKIFPRKN